LPLMSCRCSPFAAGCATMPSEALAQATYKSRSLKSLSPY
jgi:hypothetical protein